MNKQQKLARELGRAIDEDDSEKVQQLIAQGADINASGKWSGDCTMLWWVTNLAGQELSKPFQDLAAGLAEFLPKVRPRDHATERQKHLRRLKKLIDAGADVNKPSHGGTPLRIAVCGQDLEVVKLLLANGANPNAETFSILSNLTRKTQPGYRNTVLHEAVEKGSLPITEALRRLEPTRIAPTTRARRRWPSHRRKASRHWSRCSRAGRQFNRCNRPRRSRPMTFGEPRARDVWRTCRNSSPTERMWMRG